MNSKVLVSGLLGGITLFVLGGIVYGLFLAGFYATPVDKAEPLVLYIALGEVLSGFLLAWVLGRFGVTTPASGAKDGAVFGFILSLSLGLVFYGAYEMADLSVYLTDTLVSIVRFGAAGAVIGWWLGRGAS